MAGWIQCYKGVNTTTPLDGAAVGPVGGGVDVDQKSITINALAPLSTSCDRVIFTCSIGNTTGTYTAPTLPSLPLTQQLFGAAGNGIQSGLNENDIAYDGLETTNTAGTQTCTNNGTAAHMNGAQFALQPP